jgi:hypothetical protein
MKKLFLLPLTVLAFAIAAEANNDSSGDGEWRLDNYSGFPTETMASVNGNVVHSDRLRVKFSKGRCEEAFLFTTVYTYINHPRLLELKNQPIHVRIDGIDFSGSHILHVSKHPQAKGLRATIGIITGAKDGLMSIFEHDDSPLPIEYLDSEEFKASDYFNVLENSWNTKNALIAIEQAYDACKLL